MAGYIASRLSQIEGLNAFFDSATKPSWNPPKTIRFKWMKAAISSVFGINQRILIADLDNTSIPFMTCDIGIHVIIDIYRYITNSFHQITTSQKYMEGRRKLQ
mgnify:CR=1 FL=1